MWYNELVYSVNSGGSGLTPGHKYKDFTFVTYSPIAFRFFREAFQIKAEDYLVSTLGHKYKSRLTLMLQTALVHIISHPGATMKMHQKSGCYFI